ncbi:hypothetical protein Vadar_006565 [Vaccinium darrowii]|uniref:Uncharacterized protein n=1 Tax=Vaccinium darrowii TaxID=229202 RepID=A0ACB7YK85_9ERIC|nr:hypothetical protein Vadar_006565 [Vaccinium darrowii]
MMRSSNNAGEEDGEEEDAEISTDLKSKNPCFLDHCLSELPEFKKKKKLRTDMDHCFSELPKALSRSSGETKTPPMYSGETHQRHNLLRRNPVQNPSDHEVQSGQRSLVRPTSINCDIRQDKNARQCGHQKLEGGNLALERSTHYGLEFKSDP